MFLIRWCMDAISCRRNMTLMETMPLSPAKYNDVVAQSAAHSDVTALHQYHINYDVTGIRRALLDEGDPVDPPSFFAGCPRIPGERSAAVGNGPSESRDLYDDTASTCLHSPNLPDSFSIDLVDGAGQGGNCACQYETAVKVNESNCPHSMTVANNINSTSHSMVESEQQLRIETRRDIECSQSDNSFSANDKNFDASRIADGVNSARTSLFDYTAVHTVSDVLHRNNVDLLSADMSRNLLVATARSLVERSISAAVKVITDAVNDPPRSISNSTLLPPLTSDSETNSREVIANQLIGQMLPKVIRTDGISVSASSEVLTDGAPACSAQVSTSFSHNCIGSSREATSADDALKFESCTVASMSVSDSDAADEFLSASSSCPRSGLEQVLAAYAQVRLSYFCDCQSVYAVVDQLECMSSSVGRHTFAQETSPPAPFRNINTSSDDVTDVLNNNSVDAADHRCASDCDSSHHGRADVEAQMELLSSWPPAAGRDSNPPTTNDRDDSTPYFAGNDVSMGEDEVSELPLAMKHFPSKYTVEETWDFSEPGCRAEDYFFRHYVIPVDQLEEEHVPVATGDDVTSDRHQLPAGMQLDLKTHEETCRPDVDAEMEAVAAFCRAMFTPIADDFEQLISPPSMLNVVSSPESPDVEYGPGTRPPVFRRCISLRTSPGVPHEKKSVRFADALGLDLVCVRQIQNVDESMIFGSLDEFLPRRPTLAEAAAAWRQCRPPTTRRYLCACFQSPGSHPDFAERVRQSRVVLERCNIDNGSSTIDGVIRVANVAYRKTVAARVTTDGWESQTDVVADYMPRSNDGTTDRFAFQVVLPRGATQLGRRVELAVCFTAFFDDCRSETYWDNNFGANYCFECYGSSANDDDGTATSDSETPDDEFAAWMRFA